MGLKERMAMKAAEKLIKKVDKKDFLRQLREEIEKQGMAGKDEVDAALERIEKSGMKKIFDKLGITRQDIEEVFSEQKGPTETHEGKGGPEQKENPQGEV